MAARRGSGTTVRRQQNTRYTRNAYMNGNAVRKVQEIPDRREQEARRRAERAKSQKSVQNERARREASLAIQKNREREESITRGFVLFLSLVCVAFLFVAVRYLRLKSEITTNMKRTANLEATLTEMKEENDAYYSQVSNEVDMVRIKKIAIGRLGMKYPSENQMETYQTARSTYVRQYQDIPDSR